MTTPDTVEAWRQVAVSRLRSAGVEDPGVVAGWLAAERLGIARMRLDEAGGRRLSPADLDQLDRDLRRLAHHEPLQYVLGTTPFYGVTLRTDSRALIPRPETEELVGHVVHDPAVRSLDRPRLADIGTGTGCIALALAVHLPTAVLTAVDRSEAALALARENAAALGLADRVIFRSGDLLEGFNPGDLDLVVANPPYIGEADYAGLPPHIRDHEPREALAAGEDGLAVIRRLLNQAARVLSSGGILYSELGEDQGDAVASLAATAGYGETRLIRDLAGHQRIIRCVR